MSKFIEPGQNKPDHLLLSEIRKVAALEEERAAKLPNDKPSDKKPGKVNGSAIEVEIACMDNLIKQISQMTKMIQSLEDQVKVLKANNNKGRGKSWKRMGCH